MIFSQRFRPLLADGRVRIEMPEEVRRKVWVQLVHFSRSLRIQPDPGDSWERNSSYLQEAAEALQREYGWSLGDEWPMVDTDLFRREGPGLKTFLLGSDAAHLFDFIQIYVSFLDSDERKAFQAKINDIFDLEVFHWRLGGDEFFKLDGDFMGARLAANAHGTLTGAGFEGAVDEFSTAQRYLTAGDAKDAIFYAGKSFESSLKTITGLKTGNANILLKEFLAQGFIDDLPDDQRGGFHEQVLKILPFLRNQLAGHGQGSDVVQVPIAYAELSVQLAAALHNFLIAKHLQAAPAGHIAEQDAWATQDGGDIPF